MNYTKNELRAIHDFLVEQQAEMEEFMEESSKAYDDKPDGVMRMQYQWARKIGGYMEWLRSGVDQEIKDG